MALFKIYKGRSENLSTNSQSRFATEGYAYFTTDEGKLYIDISTDSINPAVIGQNRICLNANKADFATYDSKGQEIIDTYITAIALQNNAITPQYNLTYGDGNETTVLLPVASAENAGIITANTTTIQTLTGPKKLDTNGSLEIAKKTGFNYSGIDTGTSSKARTIWFSDYNFIGVPVYNTKFTYNPSSKDSWSGYDSGTVTAYGVLASDRFKGLAYQAFLDTKGIQITSYLHNVQLINHATQPYYTITAGDGSETDINLPIADATNAGVITTDAQTIAGDKTFYGNLLLSNQIKSTLADGTAPFVITSATINENLNADMVDGYHASNETFNWNIETNTTTEQIIPTRSAICRSLNNLLQASQALYYRGAIDPTISSTIPNSANVGDVYVFAAAGTFSGQTVEAGDMAICSGATSSEIFWNIIQMNINGAVTSGNDIFSDNAIARFDGTTGKIIQNSTATIDDSGNITATKFTGTADLTGTPTAPTAAEGTNTTQIATTAFVLTAISNVNTDADSYFSGTAGKININDDITSKLYVLGALSTGNQPIYRESSVYMSGDVLYGAAWNDYAEFRQGDTLEPGKCVVEVGDDTLTLATGRLIPGASIISDTFGFSIGETEKSKTPIAVSGRVLAYPYESREEFKKNIGRPVCSGPNGTVSIMTDEEYKEKGYCTIGTISAIPDYEEWGSGNVKVNNRVWIHIK